MTFLLWLTALIAVFLALFSGIITAIWRRKYSAEKRQNNLLIESINDGIVILDGQGKIKEINSSCCHLLRVQDKDSVRGQLIESILPLQDKTGRTVGLDQRPENILAAATGAVESTYVYQPNNDIDEKLILKIKVSLLDSDNLKSDRLITIEDSTEAEEIDRMKINFISIASHQLRTPLSAIKWFAEMILTGDAGKLSQEQTDFLTNIHESTERMIGLVNTLLHISRIESGHIVMTPKPTDLKELVTQSIVKLDSKIKEKKHNVGIKVQKDLSIISVDPQLIAQVYDNLLNNAVMYTPRGGDISIDVSENDGMIVTKIADTGCGIPHKCQNHIFKKFYRGANIVKTETDGSGLGLFLVRAIVESSGGKVWFESTENKGSTFWFTLPSPGIELTN